MDRSGCVADLDVTGLDSTVPPGEDKSHEFDTQYLPAHVVLYHPNHFLAVAGDPDLVFLFLRETRKLLEGVVLFDLHGHLARTLEVLRDIPMPLSRVRPLVQAARAIRPPPNNATLDRLSLYYAVENLTFAWMHFDLRYRYTKPKWLLADARLVEADHLLPLLEALSRELVEAGLLPEIVDALEPHVTNRGGSSSGFFAKNNLKDAKVLLTAGRSEEAVWPLRMAAYMISQAWAEECGLPYHDLRSLVKVLAPMRASDPDLPLLIEKALLLDRPLPFEILLLWELCSSEFEIAWQRLQATEDTLSEHELSK